MEKVVVGGGAGPETQKYKVLVYAKLKSVWNNVFGDDAITSPIPVNS